jgi:TonB family protein
MVPEPELNLLLHDSSLDQPLWKSLFQSLDEFFFPKKLPPLVLTSKPIPVKDIWGFYNYKKNGIWGSVTAHVILLGLIIGLTILSGRLVKKVVQSHQAVTLVAPDDIPMMQPAKTASGGGGGGGDHDKLEASKGKLPKLAMVQITPPVVVVRNEHPKLTAEPTVVVPPDIKMAAVNLPNLGDPMSHMPSGPPSNGTGLGGGIGSGSGGGVGSGEGPGVGAGRGGGTGGGLFRVGGGVLPPKGIFMPDPEYSDEARKAKYQGVCVLYVEVSPDGTTHNIRVVRSLGLGLDEKAIEAVKKWKFEPAKKDGTPVSVAVNIEVSFHLY